jgi:hypothetical protein
MPLIDWFVAQVPLPNWTGRQLRMQNKQQALQLLVDEMLDINHLQMYRNRM